MRRDKKPAHISQRDWDDATIPELTDADFARGKPFKDAMPELFRSWQQDHGRGRPLMADRPKVHIGFRLAADVVDGIKASGRGYTARVEKVLRDALAKGQL